MQQFKTVLKKFGSNGEKSGWTFAEIDALTAQLLKPGNKQTFRVKGKIDELMIHNTAVFPVGDGSFILPINAGMRKALSKKSGDTVTIHIEHDPLQLPLSNDLLDCLENEPNALSFFNSLSNSHKSYFSKWIESAKSLNTKAERISKSIAALSESKDYPTMIRAMKQNRNQ